VQYDAKIGGGKRAILAMPTKAAPKAAAKPVPVEDRDAVLNARLKAGDLSQLPFPE
jgi:hypothetical protein